MKKITCRYCEFCFTMDNEVFTCKGVQNISDSLDVIKDCFSEGLEAFSERLEEEAIIFNNKPLMEIKIDGRKLIYIKDNKCKMIRVKASIAKKIFGELPVKKLLGDDIYEINAVFKDEIFRGRKFINIK